jgi:hypothetical protein
MMDTTPRFRVAIGIALLAGTTVLVGCATPETRTITSVQTTTTTPPPPPPAVSTVTSTTEDVETPLPAVRIHHWHPHYAMRHHPVHRATASATTDETTTTESSVAPTAVTSTTRKITDTTTSTK